MCLLVLTTAIFYDFCSRGSFRQFQPAAVAAPTDTVALTARALAYAKEDAMQLRATLRALAATVIVLPWMARSMQPLMIVSWRCPRMFMLVYENHSASIAKI